MLPYFYQIFICYQIIIFNTYKTNPIARSNRLAHRMHFALTHLLFDVYNNFQTSDNPKHVGFGRTEIKGQGWVQNSKIPIFNISTT